jgi:deoxyribonuclease V
MSVPTNETWPTTPKEARVVQEDLRHKVIRENRFSDIATVAGVDVGFEDKGKITRAAVAVLDFPSLEFKESAIARQKTRFPYIPGFLSFREVPAILEAMGKLKQPPNLVLCDGQGLAHPRRFGLACHLGVVTGLPTIGVAKSRLTGTHNSVPEEKGPWVPLWDKEEIIGAVVRTRSRVSPLYISIGHRIDLETAIDFVLRCTTRYRLPETTRWAHKLASG